MPSATVLLNKAGWRRRDSSLLAETLRVETLRVETVCMETLCMETLRMETVCMETLRVETLRMVRCSPSVGTQADVLREVQV